MLSLTIPSRSPILLPKTLTLKTLNPFPHLPFPPKTLTLKTLTHRRPRSRSHPPLSSATSDELLELDFSFLESPSAAAATADAQSRAIASAEVGAGSRVLLSFPTVGFGERVAELAPPCELVVAIHESLLVLSMIKEADDRIRCFQGGIGMVPEKFFPFDAVFVCYFPALGISVDELLGSVAKRCSPGARLVISFDQGRKVIEQKHRQQYPDLVKFDLPDRAALEKAANDHSFQLTEFVDETTFYLAVLKFHG